MKKNFLLLFSLFLSYFSFAQGNCSKYYPIKEGIAFQYTNYDKKGKADGTADYKVVNVENSGNLTKATMDIRYTDKKGKEIIGTNYSFTCNGDGIKIDYASLMPSQLIDQYENMNMEMDISGTDIEIPNNLSVGQELNDAHVSMKVSMAVMKMETLVNMINRKVEKKESVTTPAGTFDCYVIYSDNETVIMKKSNVFPSRVWLTEGVGMVKQESYNKDGELMGSSLLTEFNN
ncbi:MAG TPA: hypothetical protein VKZ93_04170 [Arenibacter sp.]|nr:hypothetical protein [Arenibacter sp.]